METRESLKEIIEEAHRTETVPEEWGEGEIMRLFKNKGIKGMCVNEKRDNPSKQHRQSI